MSVLAKVSSIYQPLAVSILWLQYRIKYQDQCRMRLCKTD